MEAPILEFEGILNGMEGMEALSIDFPYDVFELYGVKGQVKVKITYDGVPYQGSLAKMGTDCHWLLVRKDIRKLIGKNAGDTVKVTVQRDLEERMVEIPDELLALLEANPQEQQFFDQLSFTNRKEYARWISDAKRPETKEKRLAQTLEKLQQGKKNPTAA
jgi:hypothetical protein